MKSARFRLRGRALRRDERPHVARPAPRVEGVRGRRSRGRGRASACWTSPPAAATLPRRLRARRSPAARCGSPTSTAACSSAAATGCSTRASRRRRCNATPSACRFPSGYFDCVTVGFGLRNMTRKDAALAEMTRVLKPGGRLMVLEFSKVWKPLERAYDCIHSRFCRGWATRSPATPTPTAIWPTRSASIRIRPRSPQMLRDAGLSEVEVFNLAAGVVAIHRGVPFLIRCRSGGAIMSKWLLAATIIGLERRFSSRRKSRRGASAAAATWARSAT